MLVRSPPWFLSQDPAVFRTRLFCLSGSYRITGWTHRCRSLSLDGYIQDARLLEYNDSSEMPGIASPAWNKRSEGICGCLFWISPYPSWPICPAAVSGNSQRFVRWILRDQWSVFYGTSSDWFCLSLEVDVSGTETAVIDVLVHGSYQHINLWMICQNLIGRLTLIDQRRYNLINRMQFLPRAINPGPGAEKKFCILPLCKPRVITVFLADMALGWCEHPLQT